MPGTRARWRVEDCLAGAERAGDLEDQPAGCQLHRLISGHLRQDLDVPVRSMHADPLPGQDGYHDTGNTGTHADQPEPM